MDADRSARRRRLRADRATARDSTEAAELRLKERELRHGFWRIVLQSIAGSAVLLGLGFTWLQLSDARAESARQQAAATQQFEIALSGQITDRFSRAVDQLGNPDAVDLRLGGIYALERIAQDSDRDRRTVAAVLSAFLVRASNRSAAESGVTGARGAPGGVPSCPSYDRMQSPSEQWPDVQAAASVLGRMYSAPGSTEFELANAELAEVSVTDGYFRGAYLHQAGLQNAFLKDADFRDAILADADLECVFLLDADLHRGVFLDADLRRAVLAGADLRHAVMSGADLVKADFTSADLRGATLAGADLSDATLAGADLRGAKIGPSSLLGTEYGTADLRGACSTGSTQWPEGFHPTAAGVKSAC